MKILACTDFSPAAGTAARVAAALAIKLGDTLRLVHATTDIDAPKRRSTTARAIQEELHAEAVALRESGCRVEEEILHGSVSERLLDAARGVSTRMVVLSSHSRRRPERWFVGSDSQSLAQGASVPTLVVKEGDSLQQWLEGKRTLRLFIGADFSPQSEVAMPGVDTEARSLELATARRRGLRQLRGLVPGDAEQRGVATGVEAMHAKRAADAICQAAERRGVELICLSSRGLSGLTKLVAGSVTQAVTEKSLHPVLLVRSRRG